MIGTKIRGFRHLARLVETLGTGIILFKHDYFAIGSGIVLFVDGTKCRNPYMSHSEKYLMIFNNSYSNVKFRLEYHSGTEIYNKVSELYGKYHNVWVANLSDRRNNKDNFFNEIVLLPENFEAQYKDFCEANKKQIPNVTRYDDVNSPFCKYIFAISSGSKNFYFWAINAHYKHGINIYQIEKILTWNDNYNQLQSKLSKGTITAYTSPSDFFSIVREMTELRRNKRANDVINAFNTTQKKLLKGYSLSSRDYETLSKFGKLSPKKKNNFIRKMSNVEDPVEILRQMSFLADIHFEWNKESFMDYIKNMEDLNCEIVVDKGDVVLLKVGDYEAVKRLAKATNWCISKDKKYWNDYMCHKAPGATQYVIFDFSKKEDDNLSIVGFTSVHDRGITHAHDFQNRNIMGSKINTNAASEIKSFVSRYIDCSNIYGILSRDGISLSDVVSYEPSHYKWNRDDVFNYLDQCVDPDDYYIIYDGNNKVVIIAESDDIRYFIGDNYIDRRNYHYQYGDQHILFLDFNKGQNDPEKLVFGVIHHDFDTHESFCRRLYNDKFETLNQSFDSKLEEYGLPYDIICRTENAVDRFYTALAGLELSTAKDLIKDKIVVESLRSMDKVDTVREAIRNVCLNFSSFDYLNLFYSNGLNLCDVMDAPHACQLFNDCLANVLMINRKPKLPTPAQYEKFSNMEIRNANEATYIGYIMMILKMLENETDNFFFNNAVSRVMSYGNQAEFFDLILSIVCNRIDINENTNVSKMIANYAYGHGAMSVINILASKNPMGSLKQYISEKKKYDVKVTEIYVRGDNGLYTLQNVQEVAAHAPRKKKKHAV
jgi:hypothetical protein